jgi:hypothetical protein
VWSVPGVVGVGFIGPGEVAERGGRSNGGVIAIKGVKVVKAWFEGDYGTRVMRGAVKAQRHPRRGAATWGSGGVEDF